MMSMDWLPTLLSLVGTSPDPSYPSDGIDLSAALAGAAPVPRTLCWRYLNLAQQACRSGDGNYLKILGNSFLFNAVDDPLARANMKAQRPHFFQEPGTRHERWDRRGRQPGMEDARSGFPGS